MVINYVFIALIVVIEVKEMTMENSKDIRKIDLPSVVGRGYGTFWNFKGRYRVVKGSRASKKSKTMALNTIVRIMQYKESNMLVVRKTYRTLKDSCFNELKWACERLGVSEWWEFKENPLEATYKPTGQKILFRGLDDPLKITSIAVSVGYLCWVWIEEAYEVTSEEDFDTLDESIRGAMSDGLFKQMTLTFNPWNERIWIKKRFFDVQNDDVLAMTTNYQCNEWLDEQDFKLFDNMKKNNPRRYKVSGLGEWGISEGLIYEHWREERFTLTTHKEYDEAENKPLNPVFKDDLKSAFGLDFGYTADPSTLFCGLLDEENKRIYVFDEMYQRGLSNQAIKDVITSMGYGKERIVCDSAEPKSIDELKGYGMRVQGAVKGKDSIMNGIQWIQNYELVIHPQCVNFLTEISNYTWDKDKFGNQMNKPIDEFNHLMDAMRYALEKYISKRSQWLI